MNGCIYLVFCLSGIIPTILSLIPNIAIGPIILIFGLMICEECTKVRCGVASLEPMIELEVRVLIFINSTLPLVTKELFSLVSFLVLPITFTQPLHP
jgi:xanthine/uracil/vitamin C permease (AzgA family)